MENIYQVSTKSRLISNESFQVKIRYFLKIISAFVKELSIIFFIILLTDGRSTK